MPPPSVAVMVFWSDKMVIQPEACGGAKEPLDTEPCRLVRWAALRARPHWKPVSWLSLGNTVGMKTM